MAVVSPKRQIVPFALSS